MSRRAKFLVRLLQGDADANIDFDDLCGLLRYLGFTERRHGSHQIFVWPGIEEAINLQSKGRQAKRYQVQQVREFIVRNGVALRIVSDEGEADE